MIKRLVVCIFLITYVASQCDINTNNILTHLRELDQIARDNNGNRAAGTSGYLASMGYIIDKLSVTDYRVEIQDFTFESFRIVGQPRFSQLSPNTVNYNYNTEFRVMSRSGSANTLSRPAGGVSNLGCSPSDYSNFTAGHIAIIARGDCSFVEKADLAKLANAAGIIFYNNDQGPVFSGTCDTDLPAYGVSYSLGNSLRNYANLVLSINVETVKEITVTSNILAETINGDENNVVIVGSHLDSVPAGGGINDNGSGSATNLEIALTAHRCITSPANKIRFAWWGAEELGLLGSHHYVDDLVDNDPEELQKIALNLNYDMLGSPNFFYGIYNGSGAPEVIREKSTIIQKIYEQFFISSGKPFLPTPFTGRSDYGPFIEVGIPAGGLFSGAETVKNSTQRAIFKGLANTAYDPCYHDYCDSYDNISPESIETHGKAAYHVAAHFANNPLLFKELSANKKLAAPGKYYHYKQHPDAISRY